MQNKQVVMKKLDELQKNISMRQPWSPENKAQLAVIVGQAFDMQKQFGKTTGQLENIVAGFCWILEPYPVEIVIGAFAKYLRKNSDMPSPSDLVKIIDPCPPEWKPDKSYYIKLQQLEKEHGKYALNDDELDYCRRYEDYTRQALKDSA